MDFIKINKLGYIQFYDPIKKANVSLGKSTGVSENDYKIYSDYTKKFYSQNTKIIPKRIYYNRRNELFYVAIQFKGKTYGLGSFHTLEESEKQLLDFKIFLIS